MPWAQSRRTLIFDAYPAGWTTPSAPLTVGDLTFSAGSGAHLIGGDQYGFSRQNFTDNSVQGVTIDIANSYNMLAVTAGNYWSSGQGTFNIVTNLSTYSFTVDLLNITYGFFGFHATDGEHIIAFNNGGDPNQLATGFTDVQLGNTASVSAVPVPAAVWLFGSALTGLVGIGKRKKKPKSWQPNQLAILVKQNRPSGRFFLSCCLKQPLFKFLGIHRYR